VAVKANQSKPLPNKSPTNNAMQPYKHGLYLDLRIGAIDERTSVGKAHKALTAHLRQFVGESTVVTELLLSRIVFKALKLYIFESEELNKPLDNNIAVYLSISNSLRRDLAELDRFAAAPKEADLMDYLKEKYGKAQPDNN
jgi:hypothetical protein